MPLSGGPSTGSGKPLGGWTKSDLESGVQASLSAADDAIPLAQKGAANGVVSTDATGRAPLAQLPFEVLTEATYQALAVKDPAIIYLRTP